MNNWVPLCFLAWAFWMRSKKQCRSFDHEQRYLNSLQIFIYFVLSSPNQEYCIVEDAKCLVFLQFSQKTLVFISRVLETQYQPFTRLPFRRAPCQALIFSSYFHYFLLVFWELMLGYVTFLDWYPNFLMASFYLKRLSILTTHFSNHNLNVKTLECKCIWSETYYTTKAH